MSKKQRLALLLILFSSPLSAVDFHERINPEALQLYQALDEAHKNRALHFGENMSNANQALFLAAQEALATKIVIIRPQHVLNTQSPEKKKVVKPYFPLRGPAPHKNLPYIQTPCTMRH